MCQLEARKHSTVNSRLCILGNHIFEGVGKFDTFFNLLCVLGVFLRGNSGFGEG